MSVVHVWLPGHSPSLAQSCTSPPEHEDWHDAPARLPFVKDAQHCEWTEQLAAPPHVSVA